MSEEWMEMVDDYVRAREGWFSSYAFHFPKRHQDAEHARRMQEMLQRLRHHHQARGISLASSRSTLRGVYVSPIRSGYVAITLQIHRELAYTQQGQLFQEERLECEQLHMKQVGQIWQIARVIRDRAEEGSMVYRADSESAEIRGPAFNRDEYAGTDNGDARLTYDRDKVRQYADQYWQRPNPSFRYFDEDCTNFVSQCLYAGGVPINYTGRRERGWWYRSNKGSGSWSFSWTVAQSLHLYLSAKRSQPLARRVERADQLEIGDCILYDWNGDGRFQHATIVTAKDKQGMPLVNAHTTNSKRRYWDYTDSPAWSGHTKYGFYHVNALSGG
ncbi:amidase domain-containing protein [Marinicrinis sediminis]|uniref:Amidase domain-containing protein n=1 Tax=Marinicrinis sediminis TaxID=1652465 RepID=A0ABW5RFU4_9BACL